MVHEESIKKQPLEGFAIGKSKGKLGVNCSTMMSQAYSFKAGSMITIMTEAQLLDLIDERRARGMSEEMLTVFEAAHRAALAK